MHCSTVCSQAVLDRLRQPLQPVTDSDQHVLDTAVLHLGEHLQPEPRPFSAITGPDTQNVTFWSARRFVDSGEKPESIRTCEVKSVLCRLQKFSKEFKE